MAEKAAKPVTDVKKPGNTPASATSRPIIVGRGPAIKDPMVNKTDQEPETAPMTLPSAKKRTIEPLKHESEPEPTKEETPSVPEKLTESDPVEESVVEALEPTDEEVKTAKDLEAEKQLAEDQKRQELIDKLVAEKKYFVPIGAIQKKRNSQITIALVLLLVLLAAGAVVAIDAEMIETNISLPFDLIK